MPQPDGKKKRPRLWAVSKVTPAGRARRRFNCADQGDWDERAHTAVELFADNRSTRETATASPRSTSDFGAGNERMKPLLDRALEGDHTYDLHPQRPPRSGSTWSRASPDRNFDIAICLDLLEYLPSIPAMATSLREHCRFALTSYMTADGPASIDRRAREERNWLTHATESELRASFAAVGFKLVASTRSDNQATSISLWGAG